MSSVGLVEGYRDVFGGLLGTDGMAGLPVGLDEEIFEAVIEGTVLGEDEGYKAGFVLGELLSFTDGVSDKLRVGYKVCFRVGAPVLGESESLELGAVEGNWEHVPHAFGHLLMASSISEASSISAHSVKQSPS